jgi:hypothetical protein
MNGLRRWIAPFPPPNSKRLAEACEERIHRAAAQRPKAHDRP